MLAVGELFTLIVYAQLILENSRIYTIDKDMLEQIFTFLVKDYSAFALQMILSHENSAAQEEIFHKMIKKPVRDKEGFGRAWDSVYALRDEYIMNDPAQKICGISSFTKNVSCKKHKRRFSKSLRSINGTPSRRKKQHRSTDRPSE